MTSLSPFLRNNLKINLVDDGQVEVTLTLSPDLLAHYVQLLESLSGFFQFTKKQARYAESRAKAASDEYAQQAQERIKQYLSLLVDLYDQHISSGLDRKSAIKQVAADLRADNHPWCCPDLVRSSLIQAGRPGRPGRPRRQS